MSRIIHSASTHRHGSSSINRLTAADRHKDSKARSSTKQLNQFLVRLCDFESWWRNERAVQSSFITTESTRNESLKSVGSPAFLPGIRNSRAESGLFSFIDSAATSRINLARSAALVSPGNGTTSRPVPHTLEYRS